MVIQNEEIRENSEYQMVANECQPFMPLTIRALAVNFGATLMNEAEEKQKIVEEQMSDNGKLNMKLIFTENVINVLLFIGASAERCYKENH